MHSFLWAVPIWESGGVVDVISVCCCFMNCFMNFMNDNKIIKSGNKTEFCQRGEIIKKII